MTAIGLGKHDSGPGPPRFVLGLTAFSRASDSAQGSQNRQQSQGQHRRFGAAFGRFGARMTCHGAVARVARIARARVRVVGRSAASATAGIAAAIDAAVGGRARVARAGAFGRIAAAIVRR